MKTLKAEPVAAAAIVNAIVALALIFGFHVPANVVGAVIPVLAIVLGLVARSQVTPVPPAPVVAPAAAPGERLPGL